MRRQWVRIPATDEIYLGRLWKIHGERYNFTIQSKNCIVRKLEKKIPSGSKEKVKNTETSGEVYKPQNFFF